MYTYVGVHEINVNLASGRSQRRRDDLSAVSLPYTSQPWPFHTYVLRDRIIYVGDRYFRNEVMSRKVRRDRESYEVRSIDSLGELHGDVDRSIERQLRRAARARARDEVRRGGVWDAGIR